MAVTAFYASLLLILLLVVSIRVIVFRRGAQVAVGDGGNKELARRMRVQANLTEYAPMILIGLGAAESLSVSPIALHGLGILLLAGRLCHAWGMSQSPEPFIFRVTGMSLTFAAMTGAATLCLYGALT